MAFLLPGHLSSQPTQIKEEPKVNRESFHEDLVWWLYYLTEMKSDKALTRRPISKYSK